MTSMASTRLKTARDVLRRHGVRGVARRVTGRIASEAHLRLWRDEHHIWHVIDLAGERPRIELPEGLRLVEGGETLLHHLPTIPATGQLTARGWLERGGRLFLVLDENERAVFAGWVFHGEVPIAASPRGWLALPGRAGALEGLFTAAAQRGRGIAPAVHALVADRLGAEGDTVLLVMTEPGNAASRRALAKAGAQPVADMFTRRRLGVARLRLEPRAPFGRELASLWMGTEDVRE